ncbi:MAG TPA: PepSY domain-containing protein [Methylibium sp.]|nr:PepSY domain-containing protein [Methylibium sp.]
MKPTALLLALALAATPAWTADQERARRATLAGAALPLATLLPAIERELGGRMIEVELDEDGGRLVYEIDLLLADGRVIELEVDARSGHWLKIEGARLETLFPRRAAAPPR